MTNLRPPPRFAARRRVPSGSWPALGTLCLVLSLAGLFGCGARAQGRPAGGPADTTRITRPGADAEPGTGAARPGDAEDLPKVGPDGAPGPDVRGPDATPLDEDAPVDPNTRPGRVPGRVVGPPGRQVVVLVPLSGRSARLGAELAAGLAAARGPAERPGPEFVIRDAPDGETAAEQVRQLTGSPDVAGIVGLFDRAGGEIVAAAAAESGLPAVLLTPADAAAAHPGLVWRALHTPSLVVRTAAGAGLARGGREAIILRPRTPAGESFAALFRSVWSAGGGFIAGEIDYDANKPDWKRVAKQVGELPGDTLFFPDGPVDAAQALATMASAGLWARSQAGRFERNKVREFIVLGTPDWYAPDVMRQSGRYFEGSLFPVAFATESVAGARLAARFSLAGRPPPNAIDALLWEAVLAVDKARRRAEAEGGTVAEALARETSEEATVGLRFNAPDAVQNLYVLTVRDGRFAAAK